MHDMVASHWPIPNHFTSRLYGITSGLCSSTRVSVQSSRVKSLSFYLIFTALKVPEGLFYHLVQVGGDRDPGVPKGSALSAVHGILAES